LIRLIVLAVAIAAAIPSFAQTSTTPGYVVDANTGCKLYHWDPRPGVTMTWTGPCVQGVAAGSGTLRYFWQGEPSNGTYTGQLRGGQRSGRGTMVFLNGNRYDGEWADDKLNGHGTFVFANGNRYEGQFRDARPNGYGTAVVDGTTHTGSWSNGCFRQGERWAVIGTTAKACGFE
jgi:hypothetical protein